MPAFDLPPGSRTEKSTPPTPAPMPLPTPTPEPSKAPVAKAPRPQLFGVGGGMLNLQRLFGGMFDGGTPPSTKPSVPVSPTPGPEPQVVPTPTTTPTPPSLTNAQSPGPSAIPGPTPASTPTGQNTPEDAKQKQVDDAVKFATEKLSRSATDWVITDEDGRAAMNTLKGLLPEQQSKAIEKLDPTTFGSLLSEVPEKERAQFQALVDNCHDPARKLALFAATHKSVVQNDADKARAANPTDPNADARDAIVAQTKQEVDDELVFLQKKAQEGKLSESEVQKYIDSKTDEHKTEMLSNKNQVGTLAGLPDADRVAYVKETADKLLGRTATDWQVTDGEAGKALNLLTALPPHLQGEAIKNLDKDAFENLLSQVPEGDHERFKTLVDHCLDPERKLKLWGQFHKAKVRSDAAADKEKTKDEGSLLHQTEEQKLNEKQNERRSKIVSTTADEVDDEVKFLLGQQEKGVPLTLADVDKLMERKTLESQVELKHLVNLTHQLDSDPAKRATWSKGELMDVMATFDKLPEEHVRKNPHLRELQRRVFDPKTGDVADHSKGHINFHGLSAGDQANVKHHRMGHLGVDVIQGTVTHEIGHNLHDYKYKDQFGKIQEQAVWDKNILKPADDPNRVVKNNPYGLGYVSYQDGTIPTTNNAGTWEYGRSNEYDHFAEMYSKMVNLPQQTQRDMMGDPSQVVSNEEAKLVLAEQTLTAMKPGDPGYDAASKARDEQQKTVDKARDSANRLKSQYDIMHDQVLGP